ERETLSYRALDARANRYARWALAQRLRRGETVCLMMPNRPEYMAVWLGVTRAGGVVALINTNLTGRSLAHCIDVVAPKHVIVAGEFREALVGAVSLLPIAPTIWLHGDVASKLPRIDRDVESRSDAPLDASERPALTIEDRALYIYTSGTTGLPKAAN